MNKSIFRRSLAAILLLSGSVLFTGCTDGGGASIGQSGPSHPGKAVYNDYCYSCHNPGISGAPRIGDVDEWRPRIAKGKALLLASTVNGLAPGMPAKGLCYSCTDEDLSLAVDYMIAAAQPLLAE